MCQDCGCSQSGPYKIDGQPAQKKAKDASATATRTAAGHGADVAHSHGHDHAHGHSHSHGESHHHHDAEPGHTHDPAHRVLKVHEKLLDQNDRLAERNRGGFRALGLLALNVVSSPGAGKTTLIQATLAALRQKLRAAVIVGDLATDNDAARLRTTGVPVVQITTGTLCHLEADMVAQALRKLDVRSLDLLVIENVGNLVCPASFDLGEGLRVVLLSVTEGEDKPLKYPPLFHSADVVVVTKMDLAEAAGFDRQTALRNIRQASPHAQIFELSARSGQGIQAWCDYLITAKAGIRESA